MLSLTLNSRQPTVSAPAPVHHRICHYWRRVIRNVGNLDGCANALNEKVDALMSCMASMDNLQQPIESISFHQTICFTNVDKLHVYLDENKALILNIMENQNTGKFSGCAE
ncbi:hypothetical protein LXL04_011800 [Taraxacum kok-saghyz]